MSFVSRFAELMKLLLLYCHCSYRKPEHEVKGRRRYKHRTSGSDIEAAVEYGGLTMKELQNEEKLSLIKAAEQDTLKDWGETVI